MYYRRISTLAVLAVVLVACAGAPAASPSPTPTLAPTATPTATGTPTASIVFTSERHAYSIQIPGDWTINEPPGEWPPDELLLPYEPGVDTFPTPAAVANDAPFDGTLFISAHDLAATTTEAAWSERVLAPVSAACDSLGAAPITVDGATAQLASFGCQSGTALNLPIVRGNTGYLIAWIGRAANAVADRTQFEAIVATFASAAPPAATLEAMVVPGGQAPADATLIEVHTCCAFDPWDVTVEAGSVSFLIRNSDQLDQPHNFNIGTERWESLASTDVLYVGQSQALVIASLESGEYLFWCTFDNHYRPARGTFGDMWGTLTVTE
jgi:hypothetical protein